MRGQTPAPLAPQPTPQAVEYGVDDFGPSRAELSPAQERAFWQEIQRNLATLRDAGDLPHSNSPEAVTYAFPLRLTPGLPDYAGFRVSAFAYHNPSGAQVVDYNGGTRTVGGHRGTDYALWPFAWNKLDAGDAQVVAAAAGKIVANFNVDPTDHNCNSASSDPWNYVALLHADGRLTIYGHLRYNSLTSKGVGQSVVQGEYLGTVGSSGSSSGPHLHFEVRYGTFSVTEWIDPYAGPNSQPESLWANQPAYFDSVINRLATHSAPPSTPDVCQPSIPNFQDGFTTPSNIYFYAYYRDYQGTLPTQLTIYRPDGSIYSAWEYSAADTPFSSAWRQGWVFAFTDSDPAGTWRFEATYNGELYESFFNLNAPPSITLGSPNGGEAWERHATHAVTWTDNLGGAVNVTLYRNGVYSATLASNTPSDGEFLWLPETGLALGAGYSIRVASVIAPSVYDSSDAPFSLSDAPLIARDDFALTAINTPVTVDILGNDGIPHSEPPTISLPQQPSSGTANLVGTQLVYTPTLDFLGQDVFTYTLRTSAAEANASVTVLVVSQLFPLFLPSTQR